MFKNFKIKRQLKKLKKEPIDSEFIRSLRNRLEIYIAKNPVRIKPEIRHLPIEGSILLLIKKGLKPMPILAIILILGLAGGGTVAASQQSLPGETLYPVKIFTENARSVLAFSPESKAELQAKFAAERIKEIKELLAEKGVEPEGLEIALSLLEEHIAKAADIVEKEKQKDKDVSGFAKELVDKFEKPKAELIQSFEAEKELLKDKEKAVKEQLKSARRAGDAAAIDALVLELGQIKAQKELLELKEEEIEEELEEEEERIEEQMEAREEAEEAIKDAQEEGEELISEAAEKGIEISVDSFKQYDDFMAKAKSAFEVEHYVQAKQHAKQAEDALKHAEKEIEKLLEEKEELEELDEEEELDLDEEENEEELDEEEDLDLDEKESDKEDVKNIRD